ncbi:MAG: hypothetical protein GF311_04580 [Candidatus Lokiarchaeota archaeon]|nr:hypothetical protein [Candidatus Lokiarchaeota archaeon]
MKNDQVLNDTISAIKLSLVKKNFALFNILSNRLITDSVFLSEKNYCLIGVFLREISQSISLIDLSEELSREIEELIILFIKNFNEIIKESREENKRIFELLWKEYVNVIKNIMIFSIVEEEEQYSQNTIYTDFAINYILKYYISEYKNFTRKKRTLTIGVLSEIDRLFKNFGFNKEHLAIKTIISFFNRTLDYKLHNYYSNENQISEDDFFMLQEYINNYLNILDNYLQGSDKILETAQDYIYDYAKEWRFLYMKYLNTIPQFIQVKRKKDEQLILPEDAKNQLRDLVTQSIIKEDKEGENE